MASFFSRKKIGIVLIIVLVIGLAIQFVRPSLDNPPVTADISAPPEVQAILRRACYDCHSNETRLLWFDKIQPAYSLVVDHVRAGRAALNFSYWDSLPRAQQAGKLYESLNQMEYKVMPISQYTFLHHDARISQDDILTLRKYLLTLAPVIRPDTAAAAGAPSFTSVTEVQPAPNGISYKDLAGFGNWEAISTTNRFDNGTLRVITGNPIAVKAIREGHTNPWPDGATFAKIAWAQTLDSSGEIHAGAFKQVEFMIRDREKYAVTGGWGWARWVGTSLKPYGRAASFTTECMNCHRPMADNDLVFTHPINDTLHPQTPRVITSFLDNTKNTMSVLYGNEIAARAARSGQTSYPAGAELTLLTWSQKDDDHWFGARIPDSVRTIEQLTITPDKSSHYTFNHRGPVGVTDTILAKDMIIPIERLKPSQLP